MKNTLLAVAAAVILPFASTAVNADSSDLLETQANIIAIEMSNAELDTVQGGAFDFCFACLLGNTAVVTQANIALFSVGALQANNSAIFQSNN